MENDNIYTEYEQFFDEDVFSEATTPSDCMEMFPESCSDSQKNEKFPEDKIEQLIECVQKYPAIWNIKHSSYRNRVERNKCWANVLVELELDIGLKESARRKWDSVRTQYNRSKNTPSGSGGKRNYKFAHLLFFLSDTNEPRMTTTMMNVGSGQPKSAKKEKTVSSSMQSEAITLLREINKPKEKESQSYAELTCELLRQDMETLPMAEQRLLRRELLSVMDGFTSRNRGL